MSNPITSTYRERMAQQSRRASRNTIVGDAGFTEAVECGGTIATGKNIHGTIVDDWRRASTTLAAGVDPAYDHALRLRRSDFSTDSDEINARIERRKEQAA